MSSSATRQTWMTRPARIHLLPDDGTKCILIASQLAVELLI